MTILNIKKMHSQYYPTRSILSRKCCQFYQKLSTILNFIKIHYCVMGIAGHRGNPSSMWDSIFCQGKSINRATVLHPHSLALLFLPNKNTVSLKMCSRNIDECTAERQQIYSAGSSLLKIQHLTLHTNLK